MARILGVSAVHLGRLAKDGTIPAAVARGEWNVIAVVTSYIRHIDRRAQDKLATSEIKSEELRLTIARREKTEAEHEAIDRKNKIAEGEFVPLVVVRGEWEAHNRAVATDILTLPGRVHALLPHLSRMDIAVIDREVRAMLTAIGTHGPSGDPHDDQA